MHEFHLETNRLIIRNWKDEDRDLFHLINSNDQVMEFFPIRRTREQSDTLMNSIREKIERDGYGFTAIALRESDEPIGFCGLSDAHLEDDFPEEAIEIGWRLAPTYWGKGYVTEAARKLLEFGFTTLGLSEILAFAVANNTRSTAVMERLGMERDPSRDFDHPRVPQTHEHLKHHVVYRILK